MSEHKIRWIKNRNRHYHTTLFIGRANSPFALDLFDATGECGQLSISLHPDSKLISACTKYDCYILDADFLGDVTYTMDKILSKHPDARILVISDSYDWEDAVNAFRMGAIDVIRTPRSTLHTRAVLEYMMAQQLPQGTLRV